MKLDYIILLFLPWKWYEAYVQRVWNKKQDKQILIAYHDASDWILNHNSLNSSTTKELADLCQERLDKYIMPQMHKRRLITTVFKFTKEGKFISSEPSSAEKWRKLEL